MANPTCNKGRLDFQNTMTKVIESHKPESFASGIAFNFATPCTSSFLVLNDTPTHAKLGRSVPKMSEE